ncbi:MAG: TrmH family RNA methyltransferase, partial [Lutimonas sp.]
IRSYAAALADKSKPYFSFDFKLPTAIIVGTEDKGLSNFWLQNADEKIIIPMQGMIDSLNVSVSAAILIFEAKRQRNFSL